MLAEISIDKAYYYYCNLPRTLQIATLSPRYVAADAKRDATLTPFCLLYEEAELFWMLSAHTSHVPNSEYLAISAPYGYGGPIANNRDRDFHARAWDAYSKWAQDKLILAEIMKPHPLAAMPYGGTLKLNRYVYTCGYNYSQKCRNIINKARKKGLMVEQVKESVIHQHFPSDYRQAMRDMRADPFYLFGDDYFKAISELPGAALLVCQEEESWRSAALMLTGGAAMEYHLSITNANGREIGATNFLIHMARAALSEEWCLFLGGGRTESDKDSLAKFKASFGGEVLPFNIGWHIHRPDVYNEMKQGNTSDRVLWWRR